MPNKIKSIKQSQVTQLRPLLEKWVAKTEQSSYIEDDPILFLHAFDAKEDQLLAGFFAALFAWGRRDIVINKTRDLIKRMDERPEDFIRNFTEADAEKFSDFKHRTFKPIDLYWLIKILNRILRDYQSFENFWSHCYQKSINENRQLIAVFHEEFFRIHPEAATRTRKHISNSEKNSSCKRLYLYLKWTVRNTGPVDLGLMDFMSPAELMIPLDVHVARQARILGLLSRRYNDWKAVTELTENLRTLDPEDPVKYDYALFGLGISGKDIPDKFIKNPEFAS